MKKTAIVAKKGISVEDIKPLLKKEGFVISKNPEFVICVGGDGTFLIAERKFPGMPKAIVRESKICKKSHNLPLETILSLIKSGNYSVENNIKLEVEVNGNKLVGTNEIILRNKSQITALRFSVLINDKIIVSEIIGDGIVVATPFGSTGYFSSITRKSFEKGIGLCFNNSTAHLEPIILDDNSVVQIKIMRMDGLVSADNNPNMIKVKEGDLITIKKSKDVARLFDFKV